MYNLSCLPSISLFLLSSFPQYSPPLSTFLLNIGIIWIFQVCPNIHCIQLSFSTLNIVVSEGGTNPSHTHNLVKSQSYQGLNFFTELTLNSWSFTIDFKEISAWLWLVCATFLLLNNVKCWDEQYFLDLLVTLIFHLQWFPHTLIDIFSIVFKNPSFGLISMVMTVHGIVLTSEYEITPLSYKTMLHHWVLKTWDEDILKTLFTHV